MEISTIVLALALAQHPAMPAGMSHEEHGKQMAKDAELKKRGDAAMGFDQDATTHHFLITDDGGVIQVTVNDARDAANRDAIRAHLEKVAQDFSSGVFDSPLATMVKYHRECWYCSSGRGQLLIGTRRLTAVRGCGLWRAIPKPSRR